MLAVIFAALILSACATPPSDDPAAVAEWHAINDPLEPLNRGIFQFNVGIDKVVIRPLASGYRWLFPSFMRDSIKNVLDNLSEPLNFANSLLQGDIGRAGTAAGRLLVNSTIGLAGLFDIAETMGLEP